MSISVLMSVYKSENPNYLSKSLQSIWTEQTLKPNEIVLIEDGDLTADLLDVIESFKSQIGEKLKIIINEKNLGLTKSLNKGIDIITGDYIARMDSDDISLSQRFELQYSFMEEHPSIVVLGGGIIEINEDDIVGVERKYPEDQNKILKYIVKANPIAHSTAFIRKTIFDKGYRYNERYQKNQDLKLWFDLLQDGYELHNLPDNVLNFRRTSDTYIKRSSKISLRSEFEIYDHGISSLYGKFTIKRIYPLIRFFIKSLPPSVNRFVYRYLFKKNNQ